VIKTITCSACGTTTQRHAPATLCLNCQNAKHKQRGKDRRKMYPDRKTNQGEHHDRTT
jgi:hypothetical protein